MLIAIAKKISDVCPVDFLQEAEMQRGKYTQTLSAQRQIIAARVRTTTHFLLMITVQSHENTGFRLLACGLLCFTADSFLTEALWRCP